MKCDEMLKMLNDYVDGTIDPAVCAELEKHMNGCNPCQIVVDNIRKTITLYRQGQPFDLPVEFQKRLHNELRKRWKSQHSAHDDEIKP
jgi:anti-sigma factor RsiW